MVRLDIHLLGQFQVSLKEERVSNFVSDKARALLAYLAVEGHKAQRRETLAHLLWPNKSDTRARANLRSALANLRQVIGELQADSPYLLITHQDIKIDPCDQVRLDVDEFSEIFNIKAIEPQNISQFDKVLTIYQGEFLTGFNLSENLPFNEWVLLKREQYARMMDSVLQKISNYFEMRGEYVKALPFAWRHVELEPWQETARRQLMRLLVQSGQQAQALQQFRDLEDALQSDLNITPGIKTRQLYKSILEGKNVLSSEVTAKQYSETHSLPDFLLKKEGGMVYPKETFIGRQDEISKLNRQLDEMMEGRGNIVMVAGEAGAGKTILVREFICEAQSRYPNLVSVTGYSNLYTGLGDPYLPFREILLQLSGDIEAHCKAGSFSRQYALNLWNTVPVTCQSLLTFGPDIIDTIIPGQTLLELVKAHSEAKYLWLDKVIEHLSIKQHPGDSIQQGSLFSQFIGVLQNISDYVPLLIFLDDLQWTDSGTIGLLFQLIKQIKGKKIMLVGAYRSEEVGVKGEDDGHPLVPVLHEIQREYGDVIIDLDIRSGQDFIHALLQSEPNEMGEEFSDQLYLLTGGNALFTIELLRSLRESGILAKDERGVWKPQSGLRLESLPPRTEGVIAQRISRLPETLQRILSIASIEGEVFVAEVVARVVGINENQIVNLLSDHLGKQHKLIRPQQVSRLGGQTISTYRFRHFLFQKYLYDQMDEIQRSRLHEQVGNQLEQIAGDSKLEFSIYLARHFSHAHRPEKAMTYFRLAGERAVGMSAYTEAAQHFESAIKMLLELPEDPKRNAKELDLQLQLGLAYQAIMGYANEKVGQAYQRAWDLCPSVGDVIKCKSTTQLLFSYYANTADFKAAKRSLSLLEKDYDQLGEVNPEFALSLHLGHGYLDSIFGNHQSVSDHFKVAIKYYKQVAKYSPGARVGVEPGIFCHGWAGLHQNWLGYPEKSKHHIQSILEIAEEFQLKLFTKDALWLSAWISLEIGDIESARKFTDALMKLCIKQNYFLYEGVARIFNARLLSLNRKHQEAIEGIQEGMDMYYQTGIKTFKPDWLYFMAEIYCAAGRVEDGLEVISEAEQIERKTGEGRYKSPLQRVKGDLFLLMADEIAAEEAYLQAISIARKENTKLFELEAAKHLALLLIDQGKTVKAKKILQDVYDWFTEGFETPLLIEVKDILENPVL